VTTRELQLSRTRRCNSLRNCPGSRRTIRLGSFLLRILHSNRGQGLQAVGLVPVSAVGLVPVSAPVSAPVWVPVSAQAVGPAPESALAPVALVALVQVRRTL